MLIYEINQKKEELSRIEELTVAVKNEYKVI